MGLRKIRRGSLVARITKKRSTTNSGSDTTAPATPASGFSFTNVGRNSLTPALANIGDGEAVVVVARIGEPITDFPIDGQSYTASSVFGEGDEIGIGNFVIHNGDGTIGEITGFEAGDVIYFRAFPRNGTVYNTDPGVDNPASQTLESIPTGLVSYYALDEASGAALDAHGDNDSNSNTATPGETGILGNSYLFGLGLAISIDAVIEDVFIATKGTLNIWANPTDSTPSNAMIMLSFGDTNANTSIRVFLLTNGKVGVAMTIAGVNQWRIETDDAVLTSGVMSMITVIQDGVSPKLKINNVEVDQTFTVSTDITAWFADAPGIDNARIGCLNANTSGDNTHWGGRLDEVSIWNRDITDEEGDLLYNGGNGLAYPLTGITLT